MYGHCNVGDGSPVPTTRLYRSTSQRSFGYWFVRFFLASRIWEDLQTRKQIQTKNPQKPPQNVIFSPFCKKAELFCFFLLKIKNIYDIIIATYEALGISEKDRGWRLLWRIPQKVRVPKVQGTSRISQAKERSRQSKYFYSLYVFSSEPPILCYR